MGNVASCCVVRDDAVEGITFADKENRRGRMPSCDFSDSADSSARGDAHKRRFASMCCAMREDEDEHLEFFDCIEPTGEDFSFSTSGTFLNLRQSLDVNRWHVQDVPAPEWWLRLRADLAAAQARVPPPEPPGWWLRFRAGIRNQLVRQQSPAPHVTPPRWWLQLHTQSSELVDDALRQSVRQCPHEALVCIERVRKNDTQTITQVAVVNVTHAVREGWRARIAGDDPVISSHLIRLQPLSSEILKKVEVEFPELDEWTDDAAVRRMLRAACGDEREAIVMLTKAIECRVQDRELFRSMKCEAKCDIRVIGRDLQQHPVVYFCARSQTLPLKDLKPQVTLALEAAVRIAPDDGQICLIADMTQLRLSLNMDATTLKELGASMGTMFADRLCSITIVDFSFVMQALWSTCKSLLSDTTQKKVAFLGEKPAMELAEQRLEPATCERLLHAFKINRDRSSSAEARQRLAERTTICDVPFGMSGADVAG